MTPDQFDWLLEKTKPYLLKRSRRRSFPSELRLAVTLGYLAHADSVWSKKWSFRIGRSTVYKIIPETCNAIIKALQPIYLPPMTRKDWRNVADGFYEKWNFPNCIGALDGKHVRIQAPKNSGSLFFNYKKFFSIVLMAICDADYIFKWVDIGDYGSISDGGVWLNSDFGSSLEQGLIDLPHPEPLLGTNTPFPFAFVGDEAFPLKTYLMRSYAKPKRLRHQQQAPAAQAQTIFEANISRHLWSVWPAARHQKHCSGLGSTGSTLTVVHLILILPASKIPTAAEIEHCTYAAPKPPRTNLIGLQETLSNEHPPISARILQISEVVTESSNPVNLNCDLLID
nr:PREDICTED: uncharacterized protein LOC105675896 [Linepithema humile]